jgi:adenine phosphoribosyltransferase
MLQHRSLHPLNLQELASRIPVVADFPKPGIQFRDISPLLADPRAFDELVTRMSDAVRASNPTVIFGLESRGFLFGIAIARELGLPFVAVRKPGKLPGPTIEVSYSLEYGSGALQVQSGAASPADRVAIVDDLLATGGTVLGTAQLISKLGATISGAFFAVELQNLGGRSQVPDLPITAVLTM